MKESKLIHWAFQLKFGVKLCVLVMGGMLAVTGFIYLGLSKNLGDSYARAIYTIYDLKVNVFPLFFASFYSVFVLAVVTLAIAGIAVLFSHKVAGPLFRVKKNLEAVGGGDLTVKTRFRGDDQMTALAVDMNSAVEALNLAVRECAAATGELSAAEERLRSLINSGAPPERIEEAAESIRSGAARLKNTLHGTRH